MQIDNRCFLVTGGGSGLGAACARRLVDAGARVVIADVNDNARETAHALGQAARFVHCDVTREQDGQAAVAAARTHGSGLHGLLNCAGIGTPGKVLGRDGPHGLEHFSQVLQINLIGSFNMIRLAAEAMAAGEPEGQDGERGVIINTASVAAFEGQIGQAAYAASKGGVASMTLPIARELARHGIRVMTIAPGLFDTPMLAALPDDVRESLGAAVPFPSRLGQPAEYARLACDIIGNPMLNGSVIRLDGALRMAPK